MLGQLDISKLRLSNKTKKVLEKARELNDKTQKFKSIPRNLKIGIKNLKGDYYYQRYSVDSSCSSECKFVPLEEKDINIADLYQETLTLNPYSVNLIVLKPKPKEAEKHTATETTQP